ncbi:unnamed protein product [Gongylonema pulchrum]|uniref:Uncharacterized protein n=1 Tax=Gongylonema pulchrum TaxID=637853 RepID=A0A183D7A5_9BILA|nr:unnamed protein product [Gongylonema pulchrum]
MPPSESERETYSRETDRFGRESDGQTSITSAQSIQLPNGSIGGFYHPKHDTGKHRGSLDKYVLQAFLQGLFSAVLLYNA